MNWFDFDKIIIVWHSYASITNHDSSSGSLGIYLFIFVDNIGDSFDNGSFMQIKPSLIRQTNHNMHCAWHHPLQWYSSILIIDSIVSSIALASVMFQLDYLHLLNVTHAEKSNKWHKKNVTNDQLTAQNRKSRTLISVSRFQPSIDSIEVITNNEMELKIWRNYFNRNNYVRFLIFNFSSQLHMVFSYSNWTLQRVD